MRCPTTTQKKAARQAYQQELTRLAREAQQRFVLRALYSPNQLQEQMTWFWMNHFNVDARKANLRALVGDYEEHAIRPHALGRFRDLLGATLRHPAMLRYLDNEQNAASRINENYARELMELHTLGVDGGYSQARRAGAGARADRRRRQPARADAPPPQRAARAARATTCARACSSSTRTATTTAPRRCSASRSRSAAWPRSTRRSTAWRARRRPRASSARKLAVYFVADEPPPALVERMAARLPAQRRRHRRDARRRCSRRPNSPRRSASKFRDPMHYVVSGVRLAYDDRVVQNVNPMLDWLNRMGEPLYGRADARRLSARRRPRGPAPGQMATRFEIARAHRRQRRGAVPHRRRRRRWSGRRSRRWPNRASVARAAARRSARATRDALAQAESPQDWNTFLLASPEFMHR